MKRQRRWIAVPLGLKTWGLGRSGGGVEFRITVQVGTVNDDANRNLIEAILDGLNKVRFELHEEKPT